MNPRVARRAASVVLATVAVAAGASFATGAEDAPEKAVASVVVRRVAKECFVQLVHATGYIVPRAAAVVMFNAPAFRITDVLVKAGETIGRGDVVAKAAPTVARPGDAGKAEVSIRSLASGLVLKTTAFVGLPTSTGMDPLFTLALDGDLEAAVDVPATHAFELATGQVAHVGLRDGTTLDAHVRLAPVTIDTASQSAQARIAFDAGAKLTLGRFIRATIEANRSCGLGVPKSALVKSSEGSRLQIVEDDLVVTRTVQLGLANDADVEITSGLREGDSVVRNAGQALHEGDRVKPTTDDGTGTP